MNKASFDIRSLDMTHLEEVFSFAREMAINETEAKDEMLVEMISWSASWRKESLEHYLKTGWSLGAFENGKIVGYVLCQPMLYFTALTQSLWIEDVAATKPEIIKEIIDVAEKWAKTKHLQRVYFNENIDSSMLGYFAPTMPLTYKNCTKMN